MRRIDLISAALPPIPDGIGDYTANLARELSRVAQVRVLTTNRKPVEPIAGIEIVPAFDPQRPRSVANMEPWIDRDPPDWVVLQFEQYSFGRRGWNPHLPALIERLSARGGRIAVMFHETFAPTDNLRFRIMRVWQKRQFLRLGRAARVLFFSIEPWVKEFASVFPGKPVLHLPVGSNILPVELSRQEARRRLGISESTLTLGLFGFRHPSRLIERAALAARIARENGREALLIYIGPGDRAVREAAGEIPVLAEGFLPPHEASIRLRATDIYLTPFTDGASTRRSSLMAGLAHGLAIVGTRGRATDNLLKAAEGRALLLADAESAEDFGRCVRRLIDRPGEREALGRGALELYRREFTWPRIAERMLAGLGGDDERANRSDR